MTFLKNFLREESGQDMIEYVLILAFVCVAAAGLILNVGTDIGTVWTEAGKKTTAAATSAAS
jgi:Flp pilus assembly pilin Flp